MFQLNEVNASAWNFQLLGFSSERPWSRAIGTKGKTNTSLKENVEIPFIDFSNEQNS